MDDIPSTSNYWFTSWYYAVSSGCVFIMIYWFPFCSSAIALDSFLILFCLSSLDYCASLLNNSIFVNFTALAESSWLLAFIIKFYSPKLYSKLAHYFLLIFNFRVLFNYVKLTSTNCSLVISISHSCSLFWSRDKSCKPTLVPSNIIPNPRAEKS